MSWFSRNKVITTSSIHTVHVKQSVCETIRSIRDLLKRTLISNQRSQSESVNDFVVEAGYALRYVWDRYVPLLLSIVPSIFKKYSRRSDLDVTNDAVLKRLLEKIRRLSRKVQTDEHHWDEKSNNNDNKCKIKTPTKGIAVSKEARRIDEKVRQMKLKDDSTDHKVAMGRADYISFTQYGPVGKRAISDLAILLPVRGKREAREFLFSYSKYSLVSLTQLMTLIHIPRS